MRQEAMGVMPFRNTATAPAVTEMTMRPRKDPPARSCRCKRHAEKIMDARVHLLQQ
jgi:hypothetical protein